MYVFTFVTNVHRPDGKVLEITLCQSYGNIDRQDDEILDALCDVVLRDFAKLNQHITDATVHADWYPSN